MFQSPLSKLLARPLAVRQRPKELLYAVDEVPPPLTVAVLAAQHAALSLGLLIYATIAVTEIGLPHDAASSFLATTILALGAATLLQCAATRVGSGLLLVYIADPIAIGTFVVVAKAAGLSAACGALVVSGLVQAAAARVLPRMRAIFPPEVVGVVIFMLGLSLVEGSVGRFTGLGRMQEGVHVPTVLTGALTLGCIVGLSVWSKGRVRLLSLLIGSAAGSLAAWSMGLIAAPEGPPEPLFAVPDLTLPSFSFGLELLVPMIMGGILVNLDAVGCVMTAHKMNDAGWLRADMKMIARGVQASGIANVVSGLLGGFSIGLSSANLGLCNSTGVTSRAVGMAAGAVMVVLAFMPRLSSAMALMPAAVMGAVGIYAAAFLITSGMELILSRMLDSRRVFLVGFSTVAGTAVMVAPELVHGAPAWAAPILESPLAVAASLAVALQILFRMGTARTAVLDLSHPAESHAIVPFLEECGAAWSARREVVMRAGAAAMEAAEALRRFGTPDPVVLTAGFDEYNLDLTLIYDGPPVPLAGAPPDLRSLLDADEAAVDAAMAAVSHTLAARLADRVAAGVRDGRNTLLLHFDH